MAVSIDARVGQREIDAANEADAAEADLLSKKGLLNKEPAWNTVDIINSLHPDFVANASPVELDHAVSVVKGNVDYGVTETITPEVGAIEIQNREIQAQNEELDRLISQLTLENQQARQQIRRASVSPWMAEAKLGAPFGSGGDVGAYIEQQQMGMGPPLGSGVAPTFVEDESAWGAGSYVPSGRAIKDNKLGQVITSTGHPDWGMSGTPMNPPTAVRRADGTVEMIEMPVPKSRVSVIDVTKVKSKYGAWNGKFNNLTAKQNLENLATFRKGWMTDFENKFGSAQHWGLTRPTVNGKQISWDNNRLRNQVMRTDEFLNAYDSVYGTSKGAKMIGNMFSKAVGTVGSMGENFLNKKGAGNADKFSTTLNKVKDGEYGMGAEVAPTHPKETVSGGFWGLMSFAKQNKKLFESLSGDELWALVSDPDKFWKFYEDALNAQ